MMKNTIHLFFILSFFLVSYGCALKISKTSTVLDNPVISKNTILEFQKDTEYQFTYFANGHLGQGKYPFKTVEKDGRMAGEVVRASDASSFSGMFSFLPKPIYISDGKKITMDVWMDHIGSFTLKLEESNDGGSNTSISVENTKINEWETLLFDFKDAIHGGPTFTKIAIFADIHTPATGKDVYNYFSNIKQIPSDGKEIVTGNKKEAIRIVVLGSSTAAGTGPTESRNAWVNRYRRKLQSINGYHEVINLAVGGYTTYQLLPTGTTIAEGKPKPDAKHNSTNALTFKPDAVIINLPSNDASNGYSVQEQMDNYKLICQPFNDRGIPVWVSTPQGRNFEKEKRTIQKILKDSTYIRFGRKTLDFWRDLAHWSGKVSEKYDSGDGIHLNDEAHRLIFEEVWGKDILGVVQDKRKGVVGLDKGYSTPLYREGYVMKWQDEFDGTELNPNAWSHELGDGCPDLCGWGNNEKVWYRPENTQVKNGKLIITAQPDKEKEGFWSASRIITRDKVNFHFGRIDIRAKLPETTGLWPALWLLGANRVTDGWPYCGEIDIMEEVGHIPYRVRGTVFYKHKKGWVGSKGDKYELKYGNFSDDFHVFSIDWTKQSIKYFVDDQLYAERKFNDLEFAPNDNPFLKPFYMIINCAVGGNLPGHPDRTSLFPQTLEVDYVRHYEYNPKYYNPKVEEKPKHLPEKENLWVYLMAGQSNMQGSGVVGPNDTIPNQRILTLNKEGDWVMAKEPLHFYNNGHSGMDCGYSFANSLLECVPDSVTIALIPTAVGGSGVDDWLSDSLFLSMHLWSNMKSKIEAATNAGGTFKGMIWHQGETDTKPHLLPPYKKKLNKFFTRVRNEVGDPNMPIVVGELGKFNTYRPNWLEMNAKLKEMSNESDIFSLIYTSDLDDKGDEVHFNAAALRMMGKRYAVEMAKLHGFQRGEFLERLEKETKLKSER